MNPAVTLHTAAQRTPDWYAARLGRLTGSVAADMLAKIKTGESAKRRDLRLQLALERLTGQGEEGGFVSKEMQRGIDKEPEAFAAYEALTGRVAKNVGFLSHNEIMAGCSLDGEIDDFEGILEMKCPKPFTHFSYIKAGEIPADYRAQMLHNMWISGAKWCDFISFDDRFPPELQVFYRRLDRNEDEIASYELAARLFLGEVELEIKAVREMALQVAA